MLPQLSKLLYRGVQDPGIACSAVGLMSALAYGIIGSASEARTQTLDPVLSTRK